MATYNLRGFKLIDREFRPDALFGVNVQFVTSDDFTFDYAVTGRSNGIYGISLNSLQGSVFSIKQGPNDLTDGYELTVESLRTAGGDTSTFFVFVKQISDLVTEKIYVQLSGDEAPDFSSVGAFRNWAADRTLAAFAPNDPLGPGNTLAVEDVAANRSRQGNDQVTLSVDWADELVSTGGGVDRVIGNANDNNIDLGFGNDRGFGNGGDDTIAGGLGRDLLNGGSGNDELDGGFGGDTLTGGAGDDILTGGMRRDRFVFFENDGDDTITDFKAGVDVIDMRGFDLTEEALVDAMTQVGDDVEIFLSASQSITVENITISLLVDDILY